ncbi:MAG: hypothetical protein KBH45_10280, partial [Verrucomicrobia bacterium]|nr:hypothetical protein [Verrucomicrobiota bacterium]
NSTCIRIGHLFGKYLNYLLCYLVIRWLIFKTSRSRLGWFRGTAAHHWLWLWLSIRYGMLRTHNEVNKELYRSAYPAVWDDMQMERTAFGGWGSWAADP